MKVLLKKIKRSNKGAFTIYIIAILSFIGFFSWFTMSIFKLEGIETFIRYFSLILLKICFIIYLLYG